MNFLATIVPAMNFNLLEHLSSAYSMVSVEAGAFLLLSLILQRKNLIAVLEKLWPQGAKVNFICLLMEVILIMPLLGMLMVWMHEMSAAGPAAGMRSFWTELPPVLALAAVLFIADGISYVRHRLEHTRWLWPIHAMHHSDRELSWFSAYRQHPLNRLWAVAFDIGLLLLIGVPLWAIYANALVRHYYGLLTHANVPWTFGWLGRVLVSPAMHRWHHVREGDGVGKNFATIFAVFDLAFGTYYVPSACHSPTGLTDEGHNSFLVQIWAPFRALLTLYGWTHGRGFSATGDGGAIKERIGPTD